MKIFKVTLVTLFALTWCFNANARMRDWEQIVSNPKLIKSPTALETSYNLMAPQDGYRLLVEADQFAFLVDPEGRPVVVFDLTLKSPTMVDQLLGALGIGHLSLSRIWKQYKRTKEKQYFEDAEEISEKGLPTPTKKDIKNGYKRFAKLPFKDDWIRKQGYHKALEEGRRNGFKPASFSLNDLYLDEVKTEKLYVAMKEFSLLLYQEDLKRDQFEGFMKQFKMKWVANDEEFKITWQPKVGIQSLGLKKAKRPPIPEWVANFYSPLDLLAYKYSLKNFEERFAYLDKSLGDVGKILSIFVSRLANNNRNRMEAHENAFIALIEGALRGDYRFENEAINNPKFLELMANLMYLGKIVDTKDITNGPKKRAEIYFKEDKFRTKNLTILEKKGFEVKAFPDGRYAAVYNKKGERKGLVSLALKKKLLINTQSVHAPDKGKNWKLIHRIGMEIFTDVVRWYAPTVVGYQAYTGALGLNITIYIPGSFWDSLLRGRIMAETAYEGGLLAQINETIRERWTPQIDGYELSELQGLKKTLMSQTANPFEVPYDAEELVKEHMMKEIKRFLGGGQANDYRYQILPAKP